MSKIAMFSNQGAAANAGWPIQSVENSQYILALTSRVAELGSLL
jgi:hypothetical protein